MTTPYVAVIFLSFLSCSTTWIGVALAIRFQGNVKGITTGIGFSAGIMLLISFLELVPESLAATGAFPTLATLAGGMAVVWGMHVIIPHTHFVKEAGKFDIAAVRAAYLVIFGLILHDLPEGFAMANSYIASPSLGLVVAIAIALHNIPEEFAMAAPAVTLKRPAFLYGAAFLSGLSEPVGAIIGLVAADLFPMVNPFFVAFAAGAMIFVSVHELLPLARRHGQFPLFLAGAALSVPVYAALRFLFPSAPY